MKDRPDVYHFDGISAREFGFKRFSFSTEILFWIFFFFFHLYLFDGLRFQYWFVQVRFLFSERSDSFTIIIIIIIIIIAVVSCTFYKPTLAGGLSLEYEWQQTSFQNSPKYQ